MAESELPPLKKMEEGNANDHDASKETYKSYKYALPFSMSRRQKQFLGRFTAHIDPVVVIMSIIVLALE
jgi:hypothetical protein